MSENSTLGLALSVLLCLGFLVGGAYLYVDGARAVNSFQQTEATVISSDVRSGSDIGEYYVDVTYEYTVDGRTYDSENVYPGPGQTSKSEFRAEDVVENYPDGATVTAYYNPGDPSESFLIKQRNTLMPLSMIGMGALTSLAFGTALFRRVSGFAT